MPRLSTDPGLPEHDIKVLQLREEHGWFVMKVMEDKDSPAFAYSFGLFEEFRHPEIMIFGLDLSIMHRLINDVGGQVKRGIHYGDGAITEELLEGFPCVFRQVSPLRYRETCSWATWFYGNLSFPVLQLFWPDNKRRFPWDPGCDESVRSLQPDLSKPPGPS